MKFEWDGHDIDALRRYFGPDLSLYLVLLDTPLGTAVRWLMPDGHHLVLYPGDSLDLTIWRQPSPA